MNEERWRTQDRIEAWLREALAGSGLEGRSRDDVAGFLDHNELGVAFEELVTVLDDRGEPLPASVLENLDRAAREMGLQGVRDWQRLQTRGAAG